MSGARPFSYCTFMKDNLFIYNTEARRREEFKPINESQVKFYHCGPTVYWTQHIGNLRGMVCGDFVVRSLKYAGYKTVHVRNYTDVGHLTSDEDEGEDKMEKGARREGLSPVEIADKYIRKFEEDTSALNILEPDHKPRATEYIQDMIEFVRVLLEKGYAYSTDLAVYFDVSKAENYTRLSGQKLDELRDTAGKGEVHDSAKRDQLDFAVWLFRAGSHANALQYWPSPFSSSLVENGCGFPGWHLECSAMSKKLLGDSIDIHMGGVEHIPIHHTNEIAQSEAANGVRFVNYWLHNEHLLADSRKMAKSEGTGFTLDEVKSRGFSPMGVRHFFAQAHYRSKQNFTWEAMQAAENGYKHLLNQVRELGGEIGEISSEYKDLFKAALYDDFNTPQALSVVQKMLKSDINPADKLATIIDFDRVLGLDLRQNARLTADLPGEIQVLVEKRRQARQQKDFAESDRLRAEIQSRGYTVEDKKGEMRVYKAL